MAVTAEKGKTRSPINQLYYYKSRDTERNLIIWYGNTQALTTFGQYELCGRVLDTAQELGCEWIITLGGYRQEETQHPPQIYCAASDLESLETAKRLRARIMVGQIYGLAGITIGLARLRNLKAFSLLVETPGRYPDAEAAKRALQALTEFLGLKIKFADLDKATEETRNILESFGLISHSVEQEEKKKGTQFRWYV